MRNIEQNFQTEQSPIISILQQITSQPLGVNGEENPIYCEQEVTHFTSDEVLLSVRHKYETSGRDEIRDAKLAAIEQYPQDAEWLVEVVTDFATNLKEKFEGTALFDSSKHFTSELVFDLLDFLVSKAPLRFAAWDYVPMTRFTHKEQVTNFVNKTLQHVICDMMYVYQYTTSWNDLVKKQNISESKKNLLLLDTNFLMIRALLHDLGRWFTMDSRAHEALPAVIARTTGLREDILILENDEADHPRKFDTTQPISQKTLVRIIEFFSDFFSKPHSDLLWPEETELLLLLEKLKDEGKEKTQEYHNLQKQFEVLEKIRHSELRYPELAMYYFLFSGCGYNAVVLEDISRWYEKIVETHEHTNPAKLTYLTTEAGMIESGKRFLNTLGLDPEKIRRQVSIRMNRYLESGDVRTGFPELS